MKMIFAMLHSEDVDETVEELNKEKYWVTKLSTTVGKPCGVEYALWENTTAHSAVPSLVSGKSPPVQLVVS